MHAFSKLTHEVDGEPRIISDPPLIEPVEELFPDVTADQMTEVAREFIRGYRRTLQTDRRVLLEQFRFVHLARKVVGVGSVGTRAWIALFLGTDGSDPLFLQVKEAQASVMEGYVGKSGFANHGERVVAGQHLMQASSDIFLGWKQMTNALEGVTRDFYVRQLRDWKASAEIETMTPDVMVIYGRLCGWTLARAHARSGDRIAIASYLGGSDVFDRAIVRFAERLRRPERGRLRRAGGGGRERPPRSPHRPVGALSQPDPTEDIPMALHRTSRDAGTSQDFLTTRPQFARAGEVQPIPRLRLPDTEMDADTAFQVVHDELILDGNARLNLATFVTTWMESAGRAADGAALDKNMIDKDEYPQTAELELRCVHILADLWNAPPSPRRTGTLHHRLQRGGACSAGWRCWALAGAPGGGRQAHRPAELGHGHQRAGVLGEVLPLLADRAAHRADGPGPAAPDRRRGRQARCDENTIGVVAILGSTFDGSYEPVNGDLSALDKLQAETGLDVPIHVDGAPAVSSPRSCTPTWSGTSGCRGCARSTPPATSTAWSTRASAG